MSNRTDNDLLPRRPAPRDSQGGGGEVHDERGIGLWSLIHDRLSGRWTAAIALAILLAILGCYVGYRATPLMYESTGIIRISPKTDYIMREIPETGMVPLFPSYVQTQATLIASQRVLDRAMQSLVLEELPWHDRTSALRDIKNGLETGSDRNSELIHVRFSHTSPTVAQTVVNAVIRSYSEVYANADAEEINQKLRTLRSYRQSLTNRRAQRQAQIQEIVASSQYAFSDLGEIISHKAMRLQSIETEIRRLDFLVTLTGTPRDSSQVTASLDVDSREADIDPVTGTAIDYRDLEAFDDELARLARARDDARSEMERARERFRPQHRAYQRIEQELLIASRLYDERLEVVREEFLASDRLPMTEWVMEPRQRLQQLRREAAEERSAIAQMTQMQLTLDDLNIEIAELERERAETSDRIRGLEMEADSIRRITVAAYGDLPAAPARDRRTALAAMGSILGLGSGIGFFFLLGSADRRIYGVHQLTTASRGNKLLGVLPALPRGSISIESSGVAAHCVHQIRNRVESVRKSGRSAVLTITSPYQGDGKTSLTLALAASYAASGYRTLLVDGDLLGRSLTHYLMMAGQPGLHEALASNDLKDVIQKLPLDNLSVLPVGADPTFGPERVRHGDMERIYQKLRHHYDVVLVDTGPMFGSVECLPIASAADGVIMTMVRGRRQARLDECIDAIVGSGATYLGFVLNHARAVDCTRYVSSSANSALIGSNVKEMTNGNGRHDRTVSRNALLRAMQVTARPHQHQGKHSS